MQQDFVQHIESLGFSHKESLIYVALLDLGRGTAAEISKKTGINRTTIYDIVEELERTGLVAQLGGVKKKTYRPEPPEKLPIILEKKAAHLRDMAKQSEGLVSMLQTVAAKAPSKPKIKVYEGDKGLQSLYDASLLCKTYIRSFLTADALETFDPEYVHSYFERRARKGIKIKGILNASEASRGYKANSKKLLREINLVPNEKMDIVPEVYIYDDTISIFSIKERLGVSIESKDIANAFKKLYDLAWERAEEYDNDTGRKKISAKI